LHIIRYQKNRMHALLYKSPLLIQETLYCAISKINLECTVCTL